MFPYYLPVEVNDLEDALIYQPKQNFHTFVSCGDDVSLTSLKQRYIDLLNEGELSSYCTKWPQECQLNNVDISCASE